MWMIIGNRFPYGVIAEIHHLLVPKRRFAAQDDMTLAEWEESTRVRQLVDRDCDFIMEDCSANRSV